MCERIKKAKSILDRYRQKSESVHHMADLILKDLEKFRDQLLILEVVYFVASEKAADDYDLHSQRCKENRQAQKQKPVNGQLKTNGSQGHRFI